jgi:hypothetical protein
LAALPVALLAGLESIAGLLLAGIIVGVVQGLPSAYIDPLVGGNAVGGAALRLHAGVLFIRPTGMFGWKTHRKGLNHGSGRRLRHHLRARPGAGPHPCRRRSAWRCSLALLLLCPWLASPRLVAVANLMLITAIVVVGLQINTGYAGQVNLGQAAFMGVGAYTTALLSKSSSACRSGCRGAAGRDRGGAVRLRLRPDGGAHQGLLPGADHDRRAVPVPFPGAEPALAGWAASTASASSRRRLGGLVFDSDRAIYYLCLVVPRSWSSAPTASCAAGTAAPSWRCGTTTWPPA